MFVLFSFLLSIAAPQGELVIVTEGTGLYHRPACELVRGATDVMAMTVGQAEARGHKAHPECDPSKGPPPARAPAADATGAKAKPPAPIHVYAAPRGTRYHRADCRKLEADAKKVVLDAATAKKYWPCPVCKPPIRPRDKKT